MKRLRRWHWPTRSIDIPNLKYRYMSKVVFADLFIGSHWIRMFGIGSRYN